MSDAHATGFPPTLEEPPPPSAPRHTRSRLVIIATLLTLTIGGGVLVAGRNDASRPGPGLQAGAATGAFLRGSGDKPVPVLAPSAATATVAPASITNLTMPALPLPDQLPIDWYADTPEIVMGRIKIPKLNVDEPLQEGFTLTAINRGPGWWPGTARPGELGNMVVAGHRTTYSKPFNRIDELIAGDKVTFTLPRGDITYAVRGVIVVPDNHIGIAAQTYAHVATLFACHPKGSATHRIVAKLRLLKPDGTPADKDEWLPDINDGISETFTTLYMRNRETGATDVQRGLPDTEE